MRKRVNIKEIMSSYRLRRELMIESLMAIQAQEGIITTREQAERAYDKIQAERWRLQDERENSNAKD